MKAASTDSTIEPFAAKCASVVPPLANFCQENVLPSAISAEGPLEASAANDSQRSARNHQYQNDVSLAMCNTDPA